MGYAVELSFDVRKGGAWWSQLDRYRNLAEEYGCIMQYFTHEIEGRGKTTLRSDSVQVVTFAEEDSLWDASFPRKGLVIIWVRGSMK